MAAAADPVSQGKLMRNLAAHVKDAWARVTKEIELYKTIVEQAGTKKM